MISLKIDQNIIVDYAKGSGLVGDNVVQYSGNIPDDFYSKFKPSFYSLENDVIVENPDYVAPKPPEIEPNNLEKQVATLGYQQMVDIQTINALQQQNAKMAYQIMTGGK
ncbi:DUF2977 domain-containing protein [Weissella paramesenteroides]|uniref:DUF2977 domain-containing protein n=1 Tax=Weissella paramesenteroides TaxID=1249 RepID=UPI002E7B50A7|nr:DUF2977 domain-containing protein [Weissella paramesenteroides]WPQ69027.1 DUF2977 domain-containing protein [Weissella paramesenteroides]